MPLTEVFEMMLLFTKAARTCFLYVLLTSHSRPGARTAFPWRHLIMCFVELSDAELTYFALDMAKAILHLHQQGFVHRDISVRNFQLAKAPVDAHPPEAAWGGMCTESDYHSLAFSDQLKSKDNFRARYRCVLSDFALARPFREVRNSLGEPFSHITRVFSKDFTVKWLFDLC